MAARIRNDTSTSRTVKNRAKTQLRQFARRFRKWWWALGDVGGRFAECDAVGCMCGSCRAPARARLGRRLNSECDAVGCMCGSCRAPRPAPDSASPPRMFSEPLNGAQPNRKAPIPLHSGPVRAASLAAEIDSVRAAGGVRRRFVTAARSEHADAVNARPQMLSPITAGAF